VACTDNLWRCYDMPLHEIIASLSTKNELNLLWYKSDRMKKLYLAFFLFLVVCLTSCVDLEEQYDFYPDGSCNVTYNFDMSKAISVLVNLLADSVKQSPQFRMVKDTTVNFYAMLPDSLHQKMDSAQLAMSKTSDLSIRMNLNQNIMKASIKHSANNSAELDYYLQNVSRLTSGEHLNSFISNKKAAKNVNVNSNELMFLQDYYKYDIGPHKFYRTIDKSKFSKYIKKNEAMFNLSKAMLIDMPYKITMNFPEAITKIDNKRAVLSADKKSVTIETNIEDAFKNPDVMNFKIDY
jgi:hypothetical protein